MPDTLAALAQLGVHLDHPSTQRTPSGLKPSPPRHPLHRQLHTSEAIFPNGNGSRPSPPRAAPAAARSRPRTRRPFPLADRRQRHPRSPGPHQHKKPSVPAGSSAPMATNLKSAPWHGLEKSSSRPAPHRPSSALQRRSLDRLRRGPLDQPRPGLRHARLPHRGLRRLHRLDKIHQHPTSAQSLPHPCNTASPSPTPATLPEERSP